MCPLSEINLQFWSDRLCDVPDIIIFSLIANMPNFNLFFKNPVYGYDHNAVRIWNLTIWKPCFMLLYAK